MRILWFTGNPGRYETDCGQKARVDGSWIASLQTALQKRGTAQLALAFIHPEGKKKVKINGTTYYLMKKASLPLRFSRVLQERVYTKQMAWAINDFKPDIIQLFGTETVMGLACRFTNVPIVTHIQGWMHPIHNSWYPPKYNVTKDKIKSLLNPQKLLGHLYQSNSLIWEEEVCRRARFFMGRTAWDKMVCKILAPNAYYFYCSELLRRPFYQCDKWHYDENRPMYIVSIINNATYKGADVILRTAALLKKEQNFKWIVCGVSDIKWAEQLTGIKADEVNVKCVGSQPSAKLIEHFQKCTCYVHLSYIENSPNSVCEAQLMGVPVVAANVGGVSTLVEDRVTGLLVPANDAYATCTKIRMLQRNSLFSTQLGAQAAAQAEMRHDEKSIVESLLNVYTTILQEKYDK
jgi:glycosyltransferase involved in cell wall biosynthesis